MADLFNMRQLNSRNETSKGEENGILCPLKQYFLNMQYCH